MNVSSVSHFHFTRMDNIQEIADAVQKGIQLIVRASFQQGKTRLTRLRCVSLELWASQMSMLYSMVTVVVYIRVYLIKEPKY